MEHDLTADTVKVGTQVSVTFVESANIYPYTLQHSVLGRASQKEKITVEILRLHFEHIYLMGGREQKPK